MVLQCDMARVFETCLKAPRMNDPRQLLRQAAEDFALRIYEIIRMDVLGQLGSQLPPTAIPEVADAETPLRKIVAFVERHPAVMPKDIVAGLKLGRPVVFKALAAACAAGELHKRGGGRTVQYFAGSVDLESPKTPRMSEPPRRRERSSGQDMSERLVAFVTAHPGCRYSEIRGALGASTSILQRALRDAKARDAIRMEGSRIKARYYPTTAPPQLSTEDRERAESTLLQLDQALAQDMPSVRLGAVLQAVVAQVRQLQERATPADPVSPSLDRAIRRITAIRAEKELPFIVGLKRGATADWRALAHQAWARVEAFDRDTQEVPKENFPSLQHATDRLPLVLVGGVEKNEVLTQIQSRYGLSVEWTAAQGENARAVDAFIDRVKHEKLAAVVVLEGLFRHAQVLSIVHALKAHKVPFAYGDRADSESLRRAFAELEHTLLERTSTTG